MLVDKFSDNDILNNERYKIERFIRTKEADIQIQKAKSLFNEGKYTEASELLEKTITRTDKQDNILVGYKKSFQTQQEQADKQTIEKNIQELVKKITEAYNNNTPIDDILIKYIDDLRELIGNNTDNDKLLNTALIDILKTVFEQISIAVINKDSKRFLQILEVLKKKMVFE
jgi:tetratricopeptide (TPR) repeat protein